MLKYTWMYSSDGLLFFSKIPKIDSHFLQIIILKQNFYIIFGSLPYKKPKILKTQIYMEIHFDKINPQKINAFSIKMTVKMGSDFQVKTKSGYPLPW